MPALKIQNLISGRWVQTTPPTITKPREPELRGSQPRAFKALRDKNFVILNAPTGWGKSLVIIFIVLYRLLQDSKLRCIIAIPQTLIARNFVADWKLRIGTTVIDWIVQHNLCHVESVDKVAYIRRWLDRRQTTLGDRILLCTHASLAYTYRKLKRSGQLDHLQNTMVWIDEAHHVMNAQTIHGDVISNAIGGLAKYCVEHDRYLGLATATFMRGDLRHIVPDKLLRKFARYNVPYDDYFATMQPVETFKFNIVCGNITQALTRLFKKRVPTILYLAKRQSCYATSCKYKEVQRILKILARGKTIKQDGPVIHAGDLKVLDFVTEKDRQLRRTYLDNGGEVDVILALDTCKEGFDWVKAERSVILGERHSIPEMIQMVGRLFRRCEGKKHVEVYQILPACISDTERLRKQKNSILTVIFSVMLLEEVFLPQAFTGQNKRTRKTADRFIPAISNTKIAQALIRDFLVASQGKTYADSWRLAPTILSGYSIKKPDWEIVWKRLWHRFALIERKQKGLHLDVSFEVLEDTDISKGLLTLASKMCGAMTFQELRRVIGRENHSPEEWVVIAEQLEKKHGVLPNPTWLIQNGYNGLSQVMRIYTNLFRHVKQNSKKGKSPEEWVVVAEKLERKHDTLPNTNWLIQNGYAGLSQVMRTHPSLFKHIKQTSKKGKSPEKWVPVAEKLEKKHGTLPNTSWLIQNGYSGLNYAMKYRPELFKHIKQNSKKGKSPQEWVSIAEKLEKKYSTLPNPGWLMQNGYSSLDSAMRRRPKLFKHIKQDSKRGKSPQEWVIIAEKLEKKHNLLPCRRFLIKNGYCGLDSAMRSNPNLFKHIKQNSKKGKSPEEWVIVAEKLEKKHSTLPNPNWLVQNGFSGLSYAMKYRPELFKHIKQNRRRKSFQEWVLIATKLEKKHGTLPSPGWLEQNGYRGLCFAMKNYPGLFKQIKQDRQRKSPEEWVTVAEQLEKKHDTLPNPKWLQQNGYCGLDAALRRYPKLFKHIKQKRCRN